MNRHATAHQTVGPYFSIGLAPLYRNDLVPEGVAGVRVTIAGRVLDGDGVPVNDALLELWQADADGRYAHPDDDRDPVADPRFTGFGRIATDADGRFEFTTIRPGAVPGPDGRMQAPHLAVSVFMRGLLKHLVTRIYFDGEPANADDPILTLVPPARRDTLRARAIRPGEFAWTSFSKVTVRPFFSTAEAAALPTPAAGGPARREATSLFDPMFSTSRMREAFGDRARVQGMLDMEAALARAEARIGLIPASAATTIAVHCRAEHYDFAALGSAAAFAGNVAIPLVTALTEAVAREHPDAARHVHWGATSQDIIDTGLMLQLRAALDLVEADLARLAHAVGTLATTHARTPIAGRTLLQQALPTTFGLKLAGWLSALTRDRVRLRELRPRVLALQFGGAAGTLAALGEQGLEVAAALAADLGLALPDIPWHSQRDRVAEIATTLGLLSGTLGKIARDITLLMQTEIGEVLEPASPGRGGSSTLPHKRNPVGTTAAAAASLRVPGLVATMLAAMVQEHERAAGGWHAEWETLPDIFLLVDGALANLTQVVQGLEIDTVRMRDNLDATKGLLLAEAVTTELAPHLGRMAAHRVVERACQRAIAGHRHLRDVLAEQDETRAWLGDDVLARLFDPRQYLGLAELLVARALATAEHLGDRKPNTHRHAEPAPGADAP